jgi:uracil-DNA glycosylase family 4
MKLRVKSTATKTTPTQTIWPITAPGMPPPGPGLIQQARANGSTAVVEGRGSKAVLRNCDKALRKVIREALYVPGSVSINIKIGDHVSNRAVVSGHRWSANQVKDDDGNVTLGPATGPEPCDVMVIGKMLQEDDLKQLRQFRAGYASFFLEHVRKADIMGTKNWYMTSAMKIIDPGEKSSALKPAWLAEFEHLLHQELRLVKPKYVLCVGADALKLLLGKNHTLDKVRGTVQELKLDMRKCASDKEQWHTVKVMACEHPNSVMRDQRKQPRFAKDIASFGTLIQGDTPGAEETGLDHRLITNELQLRKVIKDANSNNPSRLVAFDAEWEKQHPQNKGAYLRCVQFSWAHKAAACIALCKPGGEPSFKAIKRDSNGKPIKKAGRLVFTVKNGRKVAFKLLQEYFSDKRLVGHFGNADMEWLLDAGLDIQKQFEAPKHWKDCKTKGGWDTASMAHAVDETGVFNLTDQTLRLTRAPRYDVKLDAWKAEYCRKNKLKASQLEGYGECPDNILYPYALYDADVTRRIALKYAKLLSKDAYRLNCWKSFWITHRAAPVALEITRTGLKINRNRLDRLTTVFMRKRDSLAKKIQTWARWPTLNLASSDHVRELLFGEKYNTKDDKGHAKRIRPPGALSLYAMPAITTDKRPKEWETIIGTPAESTSKPSTNKSALGILFRESSRMKVYSRKKNKWVLKDCGKYIEDIRNYRFIDQVLKSVLRKPKESESDDDSIWATDDPFETDDNGNLVYETGLPGAICDDGRVRTFISMLKETGRWASSRPPLMNLGKRREEDYKIILGPEYEYPLRSIIEADKGYTLVEADYIGAELFGMAILSGDELMIEHALRNQLPEDHKDYYDIHSNIAVLAFGYDCPPTKVGLKSIGKVHMRIVAKSVIFGVAYGRGAKAVALAAREEGVTITEEEAQQVIDTIFRTYPRLVPFFAECKARVAHREKSAPPPPRFITGVFGRHRRFPYTTDREMMGDFERQAMNFPLQNMVADAMSRALDKLRMYRAKHKLGFKFVLQIHDAALFLVPNNEVKHFVQKVLPLCMSKKVPIKPRNLDGSLRKNAKAYNLGIDIELHKYWGVQMTPKDCWDRNLDEGLVGWHKSANFKDGWENHKIGNNVWLKKTGKQHPFVVSKKTGKVMLKEDLYKRAIAKGKLPEPTIALYDAVKKIKDDELLKLISI